MTIVITYKDGTTETYSSCTGITDDGVSLKFNGQLSGQGVAKDWVIRLDTVKKYSKEASGS